MPRTFSRSTKLGQRMDRLGYTMIEVSRGTGITREHLRLYMGFGKPISARHMLRLCAFLKCEPEALTELTD